MRTIIVFTMMCLVSLSLSAPPIVKKKHPCPSKSLVTLDTPIRNIFFTHHSAMAWGVNGNMWIAQGFPPRNWTLLLPRLPGSQSVTKRGARFAGKGILFAFQNHHDKNTVVLGGWGTTMWITRDGGTTFRTEKNALNGEFVGEVVFHPTFPEVWVVLSQTASYYSGDPRVTPWNIGMFLTRDGGNSWSKQDTYVQTFQFVPPDQDKNSVLAIWTSHDTKSGPQKQFEFDDVTFHMSDDLFATIAPLTQKITGFTYWGHILMVSRLTKTPGVQELLVRAGKNFVVAKVPSDVPNHGFTLLTPDHDHSKGPAFLFVDHSGDRTSKSDMLPWGNVYMSAGTRYERFSVSLRNVVGGMSAHFRAVHGIEGIYIANVYKYAGSNSTIETRISRDGGLTWRPIQARSDVTKECKECHIHLHTNGGTRRFQPWAALYSTDKAPGFILATGSYSPSLSFDMKELGTFLSSDAGYTWTYIRDGSHIYEITEEASVIVLAHTQLTDHMLYSLDHGHSWLRCEFGVQLEVDNIVQVPEHPYSAVIYARFSRYAFMITVDFKNTINVVNKTSNTIRHHVMDCDSPRTQFKFWSPGNGQCILGRKTSFARRIHDVRCRARNKMMRVFDQVIPCKCTKEDYECDFCFERNKQGNCVQVCNPKNKDRCTSGYRRIMGDSCVKPLPELEPQANCKAHATVPDDEETQRQTEERKHTTVRTNVMASTVLPMLFMTFLVYMYIVNRRQIDHKVSSIVSRCESWSCWSWAMRLMGHGGHRTVPIRSARFASNQQQQSLHFDHYEDEDDGADMLSSAYTSTQSRSNALKKKGNQYEYDFEDISNGEMRARGR